MCYLTSAILVAVWNTLLISMSGVGPRRIISPWVQDHQPASLAAEPRCVAVPEVPHGEAHISGTAKQWLTGQ